MDLSNGKSYAAIIYPWLSKSASNNQKLAINTNIPEQDKEVARIRGNKSWETSPEVQQLQILAARVSSRLLSEERQTWGTSLSIILGIERMDDPEHFYSGPGNHPS